MEVGFFVEKGPDLETGAHIFPDFGVGASSLTLVNFHILLPRLWLLNLVGALINAMIGLLQRVSGAAVAVEGEIVGQIDRGLMVLVAVHRDDDERDIARLAERILTYRVFPDADDRMNRSLLDEGLGLLLVPQFTLAADTRKGTRASFTKAAAPEMGADYFERLVAACRQQLDTVETGRFGANMQVTLTNDGPVTFWLET
jgi:D-tyrosyl-tRNA(Tyr) deacylase